MVPAMYEKVAADRMVPPQQQAAFARKAHLFRILRVGAPAGSCDQAGAEGVKLLLVWRRRERRRCVFDDSLPVMKAGDQQTATKDGDDGDNDTHELCPSLKEEAAKRGRFPSETPLAKSIPR
jgi:hypothetical protein